MGYIPKDARWYLAEIVEEIRIEDDPTNVVHINLILVEANSPEQAYEKSNEIGKQHETSYENTEGKLVTIRFRGLRDLNVIHDELENGAEIIYERELGLSESNLKKMIRAKRRLGVFRPMETPDGPNFMPKHIFEEVVEYMKNLPPDAAEPKSTHPSQKSRKRSS